MVLAYSWSFQSGGICSGSCMLLQSAIMGCSQGNRCTEQFFRMCSSSHRQLPICLAVRAQLCTSADCLKPTVQKKLQSLHSRNVSRLVLCLVLNMCGCQDHAADVLIKKIKIKHERHWKWQDVMVIVFCKVIRFWCYL